MSVRTPPKKPVMTAMTAKALQACRYTERKEAKQKCLSMFQQLASVIFSKQRLYELRMLYLTSNFRYDSFLLYFSDGPTRQAQHGGVILAVGHPCGVGDAVPPEVGVVVGGGQHDAAHLGEGPVLSRESGAHQDPATQTGHEAADLHVHHHRLWHHGE